MILSGASPHKMSNGDAPEPPHDLDAEQGVIASVLIDPRAMLRVADRLQVVDFFDPRHQAFWAMALRFYEQRKPLDFKLIPGQPEYARTGGLAYLESLYQTFPTSVYVESYADEVLRNARLRRLIDAGADLMTDAYRADDPAAVYAAAVDTLTASQDDRDAGYVTMPQAVEEQWGRIGRGADRVIPFGLHDLDRQLGGGMRDGQLVVVAARPGVGKSSLALGAVSHTMAVERLPVGLISLEMSRGEVMDRLVALETGVNMHRVQAGTASDGEMANAAAGLARIREMPLYLDDRTAGSVADILTRARQLVMRHDIRLLVVDYLQLMHGNGRRENRVQEVSEITRGLKQIARELTIPVLALSQLSRAVEQRADQVPSLGDLRESGSIEQDADVVVFIYAACEHRKDVERGVYHLIVAKQRMGPAGTIQVSWLPERTQFVDLSMRAAR